MYRPESEVDILGKSSQAKGRAAELEVCRILNDGGINARPGIPMSYGVEPDVCGVDNCHVEVKRHERIEIGAWMAQAERDARRFQDGAPVVMFRRNRESWRVCMNLSDWIIMYQKAILGGYGRFSEGGDLLTAKQTRALESLLEGHTKRQAAAEAGCSESTLRRWATSDQAFIAAYKEAVGATLEVTVRKLQAAALDAADTLHSVAMDTDAAAGTRIQAADRILAHSAKLTEALDVETRINELEKAVEEVVNGGR